MEPTRIPLGARRSAALAAVVAAAALAIPSAASAAVTGTVTGDSATLVGDAANDNIVIGVTGANLSHNLTGFNSPIDFDSGTAGDQTLTAAGTLTIDGGAGDDTIIGGQNNDHIIGGDGNDRITGFRGADNVDGGAGNDIMIWNNGDGSDTNDGDDGADQTLIVTGAADDQMEVKPIGGGRTEFKRINAPFSIDMGSSTERLNITSFAGNDTLTQTATGGTVPITIDAGPGDDTITGADGADLIQGGDGVDTLSGGAGDDRIVGNPGNDAMNGGAGDDTMVWNNGDGNDTMNGDDGLDRIENNLGAAPDVSQISVVAGKVHYARTNAPFTLDVATSEVFELNTFGGNDTLDVQPGVGALIAITADAGSGDDRLNGGDEADTFSGGLGNDTLDPGAGADSVDGQAGDDTLKVRDGAADFANGGIGTDSAVADVVDALAGVETADVPPPNPAADTKATAVRILSRNITSKLKRGTYTARVRIECPAAEAGGCKGTLALLTANKVRIGGVKVQALLGSKSYSLKAGQRRTLAIKLPKGVGRFANKRKLSLRAQTVSRDAAGNVATGAKRLTVKLVKPKK
ncbi:MAG: calcium-binding protein [Solirubrobacteraceae bacterium]